MVSWHAIVVVVLSFTLPKESRAAFSSAGCGSTKSCQRLPDGCDPSSADCVFLSWTWDGSAFQMELSGGAGDGNTYAAVAFGQVNGMQDAELYYCTGSALESGVITTARQPPSLSGALSATEVTVTRASTVSGVAECEFTRVASVNRTISGSTNKVFDLATENYYILLARGSAGSGNIEYHGNTNRAISAGTVDMTQITESGSAGVPVLVKAHGALMMTAWLLLSNLGIAIAANYRPLWPNTRPGGVAMWFTLHRLIMVAVLLLTAIAFIIIFVQVDGFSSGQAAHAGIGITVMCLTIINPVTALFRPKPHTRNRVYFNWIHRIVAYSLRGLATANLFIGINAVGSMASWSIGVLGGAVGFYALMEFIIGIATWRYGHYEWTGGSKTKDEPQPADSELRVVTSENDKKVKGQTVKNILLIVYALGLLAFSITYYVEFGRI